MIRTHVIGWRLSGCTNGDDLLSEFKRGFV